MARLFECLVVYGAGLTLAGCGARSQLDGGLDASGDGGGGTSTGKAGTGGIPLGGRPELGSGGSMPELNLGGTLATAGAGSSAGVNAGGSMPVDVPPKAEGQWSCDDEIGRCSSGGLSGGFALSAPCMSDPSRPRSAADCAPGQRFACLLGSYGGKALLFNCECVAPDEDCPCPQSRGGCFNPRSPEVCDKTLSACSCAYTCITK